MATIIRMNGEQENVEPENPKEGFTYEELDRIVGGFERVTLDKGRVMLVNANASYNPAVYKPNDAATKMLEEAGQAMYGQRLKKVQVILGDVLLAHQRGSKIK